MSTIHYAPDGDQQAVTLCGLQDRTAVVVWERRKVTCDRCARRFDESLTALRRTWVGAKHREDPRRVPPPTRPWWQDR